MNIHFTSTPCPEASAWLDSQPDIQTAWKKCPRGGWLWWALRHLPGALPNKEISVAFARWCERRTKKFADAAATTNIAAHPYAYAYTYACINRATAVHAAAKAAANHDGDDAACAAARNAYDAAASTAYVAAHIADVVVSDDAACAAERLEQAKWIRRHVQCPHLTP